MIDFLFDLYDFHLVKCCTRYLLFRKHFFFTLSRFIFRFPYLNRFFGIFCNHFIVMFSKHRHAIGKYVPVDRSTEIFIYKLLSDYRTQILYQNKTDWVSCQETWLILYFTIIQMQRVFWHCLRQSRLEVHRSRVIIWSTSRFCQWFVWKLH